MEPFVANSNAQSAVPRVIGISRRIAAAFHGAPDRIKSGIGHSMCFAGVLTSEAPARFRFSALEFVRRGDSGASAIACATPFHRLLADWANALFYRELSVSITDGYRKASGGRFGAVKAPAGFGSSTAQAKSEHFDGVSAVTTAPPVNTFAAAVGFFNHGEHSESLACQVNKFHMGLPTMA